MADEWIRGVEGHNRQFVREALLNYAMNRWGLNKASSVGKVSELIRRCTPSNFQEWESFYFQNAVQEKRAGIPITRDYLVDIGRKLYIKLSEVVQSELASITEDECIDFVLNLVINRTYEGYLGEIRTVYGQLQNLLGREIKPAPDEWDRLYNVDFFIPVDAKAVGIQIKPISFDKMMEDYRWREMQNTTHKKFKSKFGGTVFIVFSVGSGEKKVIRNLSIVDEIKAEIARLERQV